MTKESAKKIALEIAVRTKAKEPVWMDRWGNPIHRGVDAGIDEVIRILDEIEQIHPDQVEYILLRSKRRPLLRALCIIGAVSFGLGALTALLLAWW